MNLPSPSSSSAISRSCRTSMQIGSTPKVSNGHETSVSPVVGDGRLPFESSKLTCSSPGAWTIHLVLIVCLKIVYDIIPGVSQEMSWTLTNITYMVGSYIMFHYVRGVPFEFNSGAYDNLNMWEQIDDGAQYTPAKKFLLSVPIVLFLLSTHYTHYDLTYFTINVLAVLAVIIPKLPFVSLVAACSMYICLGKSLTIRIRATACASVYSLAFLRIRLHLDRSASAFVACHLELSEGKSARIM